MVNSSESVSAVVAGETFTTPVEASDDHAPGSNSGDRIPFPADGSRCYELSVMGSRLRTVLNQCKAQGIFVLSMTVEKQDPRYTLTLMFPEAQQDLIP